MSNKVLGLAQETWDLAVSAAVCLNETFLGKPQSCPPCWKCAAIRYALALLFIVGPFWINGVLGLLFWIGLFIYGCAYGEGRWEAVRGFLGRKQG